MQRWIREHGAQPVAPRDLDLASAVQARDRRGDRRGREKPGEPVVEHGEREPVATVGELRKRKADEARVAEARGERQCAALVPLRRHKTGIAVPAESDEPAGEDRGSQRAAESLVEIDGEKRDEDEHRRERPEEGDPHEVAQPRRRTGELHGGPEQEEEQQQEALAEHPRRLLRPYAGPARRIAWQTAWATTARNRRGVDSAAVKVLLVGSGGREHALAWKLAQAPGLTGLHAAPGNPGIAALGDCHPVRADDAEALLGLARSLDTDLAVIGPEAPLVAGVADALRRNGVRVFGPGRAGARIEGSKSFAKDVMAAAGVPTAETFSVARPPCVVKVDGLAAGKGVFVCETAAQLDEALRAASAFEGPIVIEELLAGDEVSVFALCDGQRVLPLAPAQDFKRIGEGDTGPNTGGMGSFSPVSGLGPIEVAELVEQIHRPVIDELARRGAPFIGVLFAGLMLTESGPKVLEFNARFGDPETQSILPRLGGDLLGALAAAAGGDLDGVELAISEEAAVSVVLAADGYPERADVGTTIEGIEDAEAAGALVFHAGTALRGERLVTNGGRILSVTGTGATVAEARERAYDGCGRIRFDGMQYRRDIALDAAAPPR